MTEAPAKEAGATERAMVRFGCRSPRTDRPAILDGSYGVSAAAIASTIGSCSHS
jgi:hypothetical protein